MNEDEVQKIRRTRLSDWLKANGGARHACEKRGLARTVESHISQILGGYSFGARAARNMEKKLGMPDGYLEGEPKALSSLSPDALMLAKWFDRLTDGKDRSEAYFIATEAIVGVLGRRGPAPTPAPKPPAKSKKQPA